MTRLAAVLTAVGTVGALSVAPVAAATSVPAGEAGACSWKVVDNPSEAKASSLAGVTAFASDDVWTVGSTGSFAQVATLAQHWDGTAWKVVETPNPIKLGTDGNSLGAVDGAAPNDVWAVGTHLRNGATDSRPLVLHFDGAAWKVVRTPVKKLTGSFFDDVVAIAADDVWAVGGRNGKGSEQDPLAMHWNGKAWTIVKVPNPPGFEADTLFGVAATGSDDVWAVGQAGERTTLVLHFNGSTWAKVKSPNAPGESRNALRDVVAMAPDDVWAVGDGGVPTASLAEHWDGHTWSIVATAHRPQFDQLFGLASVDSGDLWAVGSNQTPATTSLTFAEHFDGTAWALSDTPSPGTGDRLAAVTTIGSDVWAVGATASSFGGVGHALIEHRC